MELGHSCAQCILPWRNNCKIVTEHETLNCTEKERKQGWKNYVSVEHIVRLSSRIEEERDKTRLGLGSRSYVKFPIVLSLFRKFTLLAGASIVLQQRIPH